MRPKVKFCGFRRAEDLDAALALKIDYAGINFYPGSKRYIGDDWPGWVAERAQAVPLVGVFVDPAPELVARSVRALGLRVAQLHALDKSMEELWRDLSDIREHIPGLEQIWVALAGPQWDEFSVQPWLAHVDAVLLDSPAGAQAGGTGQAWDLQALAAQVDAGYLTAAGGVRVPLWLAGGLNPTNVAERAAQVQPYGVDVASGIEGPDGYKSIERMRDFVGQL